MQNLAKKGFTLIELLVVITIIGILATGAVTTFTSQIQKARDSTRISDIKALQTAVEQVYQDAGEYPTVTDSATFATDVANYLPNLPEDTKNNQSCATDGTTNSICGYVYNVGDSNGDGTGVSNAVYEFSAGFENQGNVDNRASNSGDNGDNESRYEVSNNSSVAPDTGWASTGTPDNGINIVR